MVFEDFRSLLFLWEVFFVFSFLNFFFIHFAVGQKICPPPQPKKKEKEKGFFLLRFSSSSNLVIPGKI